MSRTEPTIPADAFERILRDAIVRPAGRSFRGEPARQVEILRFLRDRVVPVAFVEVFEHLRAQGLLRTERDDDLSRKKTVRQALIAINEKLGGYFFRAPDLRLLPEMFRIQIVGDETDRPSAVLQDFFGIRKASGVRFFASSSEPSGGITRELYDLVSEVRPHQLDVFAASCSSFLGNPEFRALLEHATRQADGRLRFLLLDPKSASVDAIERAVTHDVPLRGGMQQRIESSLRHLAEIRARLEGKARDRLQVRLSPTATLWRFRMIFLPDVLHLRLTVPGSPDETLVKLDAQSSLFRALHDVFDAEWERATPV
jgi:hypothetical protein